MAHWFQLATLAMVFGFALSAYFASTSSGVGSGRAMLRRCRGRRRPSVLPSDAVVAAAKE
jgi:hypothetical protein